MERNSSVFLIIAAALVFVAFLVWQQFSKQDVGKVVLSEAVATPVPGSDSDVFIVLKLNNEGGAQQIKKISSPDAGHAMIHGQEGNKKLTLPANGSGSFSHEAAHIMLHKIGGDLDEGRLLTVKIDLDPAGSVVTKARFTNTVIMTHGDPKMKTEDGSNADQMEHRMGGYSVPADELAPSITITAKPAENAKGWTIQTDVQNFEFSKELADGDHKAGIGHGHIYLNGLKLGRVYETTSSIPPLPKGDHLVRVTLNTNDHQTYMVNGKTVTATTTISVD